MPRGGLAARRTFARAKRRARRRLDVRAAIRQAEQFCRSRPASVRVCWDLDNTLVDSGALLRAGRTLDEAIVEAYPVPNMIAFYEAMRRELPHATHFILSARATSMRPETLRWFVRHGLAHENASVCLIPDAAAKPKVWWTLARSSHLVIVDDLSFNHEAEQVSLYDALISEAERAAQSYVGLGQISTIAANRAAVMDVTARIVETLRTDGSR